MLIKTLYLLLILACQKAPAFSPPAWSLNQPIYEVNLDTFRDRQGFKGLQARLPELKALGVGILWLMPVTTRGVEKAFGSPYCVKDYKGLHAPFGSSQNFKNLISAAHQQGLHVILDWVANHSAWDNAAIKEHPDYYVKGPSGAIRQAFTWYDVAQLDYKNAGMRAWMIDSMAYWVRTYDIDGFRCDVAWGVPVDFWVQARTALEKIKPLYMLAEANDAKYAVAFDSDYDLNLLDNAKVTKMTSIAQGGLPASAIDTELEREKGYPAGFMRMRFTSNHDEWQHLGTPFERLGEGVKALAVLAATLPGKPLIYNGQEIGWKKKEGSIVWSADAQAQVWRDFYMRLFRLHQVNAAMHGGSFTKLKSGHDSAVYAFIRQSGPDKVLVVINLSRRAQEFKIKDASLRGSFNELFSGARQNLEGATEGRLEPWAYQVLWLNRKGVS